MKENKIDNKKYVIRKTKEVIVPGVIYLPYVMVEHTEESSKEYDDFMKEYKKLHECCPDCGEKSNYETTLVGYILNMDKKEEYQNKNTCICERCGSKHIFHDRVEDKQVIREKKLKRILE